MKSLSLVYRLSVKAFYNEWMNDESVSGCKKRNKLICRPQKIVIEHFYVGKKRLYMLRHDRKKVMLYTKELTYCTGYYDRYR